MEESNIKAMKQEWETLVLNTNKIRGNLYMAEIRDEYIEMLDKHIEESKNPGEREEKEAKEWKQILQECREILNELENFQKVWIYLVPLFQDGESLQKNLPKEYAKLLVINKIWKEIMDTVEGLKVIDLCKVPGLVQKLNENREIMDGIQKSLLNYLAEMRDIFPRFYFLSDDDVLEIQNMANLLGIRPHISKIFTGMKDLDIGEDMKIKGMISHEEERVEFSKVIDGKEKRVEVVLEEIEEMMKLTIRENLERALTAYKDKSSFLDWVLKHSHPAQCLHAACSVEWTRGVEKCLNSLEDLSKYRDQMNNEIMDLCESVKANNSEYKLIGYILVRHVHRKDIVELLLKGEDSQRERENLWKLQLRTYWENGDCYSKCLHSTIKHSYEYIGNPACLVRTPLTDRAYRSIMTAQMLGMGSYPAGPAGVGKTETSKDLSRDLQAPCRVINCSDQLNHLVVGKILEGVVKTGTWVIFDEFNRIDINVLNPMGEQLETLFTARANNIHEVEFKGRKITMDPAFHICLTCNPGYNGRTQLPSLFRKLCIRCSMMVPDYSLISIIKLYSLGGFKSASILGPKLVLCFKLCSEQLSLQRHYDYGMRAVQATVREATMLHRASPETEEEQLLVKALDNLIKPRLTGSDLPIFENIISDIFQKHASMTVEEKQLNDAIKLALKDEKLRAEEGCIGKISEIFKMSYKYGGMGVIGKAGSGKSTNIRVAAKVLGKVLGNKVHLHTINPNSMTLNELYGYHTSNNLLWKDGAFSELFRKCSNDQGPDSHWIILDGPPNPVWLETLHTVLDDNKLLCLPNGDCIPLSPKMKIILKAIDLNTATPATVSRCGVIYHEPLHSKIEEVAYPQMVKMDKIDLKELSSKLSKPSSDISTLEQHFLHLLSKYDAQEVEYFLNKHQKFPPEPIPSVPYEWMDEQTFERIYTQLSSLKDLPAFKDIDQKLKVYETDIRNIYEAEDPTIMELPGLYEGKLNEFQRLIFMKILRPDKLLDHIENFVSLVSGGKFRRDGIKEGCKSLKENIEEAYECIDQEEIKHEDPKVVIEYRRLVFGLLYLHGAVLERMKYGHIGWNTVYPFGISDLILSQKVVKCIMESTENGVPINVIQYMIGEICFGGTLSDDKDRRCMINLVNKFISHDLLADSEYKFSHSHHFYIPECANLTVKDFRTYIRALPNQASPQLAGLPQSAQIMAAQLQANHILETVSNLSPTICSSPIFEYVFAIESCKIFDLKALQHKFPLTDSPYNRILIQELTRLNDLINTMRESMTSAKVSQVANDIFNNTIPEIWIRSYPISPMSLSKWLLHLQNILKFYTQWTQDGTPVAFWLPGNLYIYIYIYIP